MKYLRLKTKSVELEISKIVLGTDYFGTTVPKEAAFNLLDKFIEAGGNCIDTARMYAQWLPNGEGASEKLIGEWLGSRGIRERVLISTKGGHPPLSNMSQGRLSRSCIFSDLEESLLALRIDSVDIYWLHRDDMKHPVADIMESLHELVLQGKVRTIGCSNWKVKRIKEANDYAAANGLTPFAVSQIQWSLASSTPQMHKDPTIVCMNEKEYHGYLEQNMPLMAYSSQAKGFFAKAALKGLQGINQKALERFCTQENIARLERVIHYAKEKKLTPTAVALGYILCNKLPAMAIAGCKTMEQLEDTLTAADVELPEDVINWLF